MLTKLDIRQFDAGPSAGRSQPIDAVRGFALLGIIVVNAQFFAAPITAAPVLTSAPDTLAFWFVSAFAMGKFFLIFSFLFGFGFATILTKSEASGQPVRGRFLRRLLALFVFGILHATFLFSGDILMLYACLGLALWMCRNWPVQRLIAVAAFTYAIAIACQVGVVQFMGEETFGASVEPGKGYLGGFLEGARQRVADWPIVLTFVLIFNGPAALAMFLLGLAAGRSKMVPPSPAMLERLVPLAHFTLPTAMVATGIAAVLVMPGSASLTLPQVSISAAILDAFFCASSIFCFGCACVELGDGGQRQRVGQMASCRGRKLAERLHLSLNNSECSLQRLGDRPLWIPATSECFCHLSHNICLDCRSSERLEAAVSLRTRRMVAPVLR